MTGRRKTRPLAVKPYVRADIFFLKLVCRAGTSKEKSLKLVRLVNLKFFDVAFYFYSFHADFQVQFVSHLRDMLYHVTVSFIAAGRLAYKGIIKL